MNFLREMCSIHPRVANTIHIGMENAYAMIRTHLPFFRQEQEEISERKSYIRFLPLEPAIVLGVDTGNEIKLKLVNNIIYAAVGLVCALFAIAEDPSMTVGGMSGFLSYASQYAKPFNELSGVVTELQSSLASALRIFELLDAEEMIPDADDAAILSADALSGRLEAHSLAFSYNDKPFMESMNFWAKPGQRIAIVGPTGCGKTTLVNLFMRFYEPTGGSIEVDGKDISKVTRKSLRSCFGMVLQDTWLSSGTIRENIAFGNPDASMEEIIAAAKKAHAHSFIMRLPKGYDTPVGESGGTLSQGQKQLLCITRVMLCLPPMLILDEATSSIDTRTEIKIQQAFARMMEGRTSFIVAHRLSTIREADVILVMKDGNIIEQGSHETLLERGGFYAELYHSQFAG